MASTHYIDKEESFPEKLFNIIILIISIPIGLLLFFIFGEWKGGNNEDNC